jgi:hypothetical protein
LLRRLNWFMVLMLVAVMLSGCRIREWMVSSIIRGELGKIREQKAHQAVNVARVARGEATEEIHFTVDFSPIDRLRYTFRKIDEASPSSVLIVTTEKYALYDLENKRAEQIINLPAFKEDTFKEFRAFALKRALQESQVTVGGVEADGIDYWLLETEPLSSESLWQSRSESWIVKETKNNVRAVEYDATGRKVSEFLTEGKDYDVRFPAGHYQMDATAGWDITTYNFAQWEPLKAELQGKATGPVPGQVEPLSLRRVKKWGKTEIYDYTRRQMVLLYISRPERPGDLWKEPVSREIVRAEKTYFLNYAGTYYACRWRSQGRDHLVFTNLGPETAVFLADQVEKRRQNVAETKTAKSKDR